MIEARCLLGKASLYMAYSLFWSDPLEIDCRRGAVSRFINVHGQSGGHGINVSCKG